MIRCDTDSIELFSQTVVVGSGSEEPATTGPGISSTSTATASC